MDSTTQNLTLNKKCDVLLQICEETIKKEEKHLSGMLKSVYKPMLMTIRMFLSIRPESDVARFLQHVHILREALECQHASEQDFREHITDIVAEWKK